MFARLVTTHLKPGKFDLVTRKFEEKIIPTLRKQPGFRDEVSFFDADRGDSLAISFWTVSKVDMSANVLDQSYILHGFRPPLASRTLPVSNSQAGGKVSAGRPELADNPIR